MGRFRRRLSRTSFLLAAFIMLVSVGTAIVRDSGQDGDDGLPAGAPTEAITVAVERIIDGDTLDVRSAETALRVRLYGADTPERGEACFTEATERLTALAGERVFLVPDARPQDRFGRELRYVFTEDGRSIDHALVSEGLAKAWREDGSRRTAIIAAEEAARAANVGCLWAKPR